MSKKKSDQTQGTCPKNCKQHVFSMKPLRDDLYYQNQFQVDYCPQFSDETQKAEDITPRIFSDGQPHFPTFIIQLDQLKLEQNQDRYQEDHLNKKLDYQRQQEQLYEPKPGRRHKYCGVCKNQYDQYITHIKDQMHVYCFQSNPVVKQITQMCDEIHNECEAERNASEVHSIKLEAEKLTESPDVLILDSAPNISTNPQPLLNNPLHHVNLSSSNIKFEYTMPSLSNLQNGGVHQMPVQPMFSPSNNQNPFYFNNFSYFGYPMFNPNYTNNNLLNDNFSQNVNKNYALNPNPNSSSNRPMSLEFRDLCNPYMNSPKPMFNNLINNSNNSGGSNNNNNNNLNALGFFQPDNMNNFNNSQVSHLNPYSPQGGGGMNVSATVIKMNKDFNDLYNQKYPQEPSNREIANFATDFKLKNSNPPYMNNNGNNNNNNDYFHNFRPSNNSGIPNINQNALNNYIINSSIPGSNNNLQLGNQQQRINQHHLTKPAQELDTVKQTPAAQQISYIDLTSEGEEPNRDIMSLKEHE